MVDECLTMVVTCLNNFPHKHGISPTLSPASIVLGHGKVDASILKATFGRYYEVYQGTDNTNKERRVTAICLRPSSNKGGYYFMTTETGKRIHGYNFVELSMPQFIIDRVHELVDREHVPDLDDDGCTIFEWVLGHPVFDLPPPPAPTANPNAHNDLSYDDDSDDDLLSADYSEENDTSISDPDDACTAHTPQQEARSAMPDPITIDDNDTDDIDNDDHTNTIDNSVIDNVDVNNDDEVSADVLRQAIEEVRSEIDPENIINTRRQMKPSSQPNISSLGGKKYHPDFLNLDNEKFTNIEQNMYSAFQRQRNR